MQSSGCEYGYSSTLLEAKLGMSLVVVVGYVRWAGYR